MRKARKQNGSLYLDANGSKTPVWMFSWSQTLPSGKRVRRKRQVGTLDQYKTEAAADRAVRGWRLAINSNGAHAFGGIKMQDIIAHFRLKELDGAAQHGRAWSTRDRYDIYLRNWIEPRWGKQELAAIKAPLVEEWWHTFRRTYATLLKANGEDVKVVQELLRHGSSRVTMDVYAQAQMPAKRAAQQKVVEMVRTHAAQTAHRSA